MDVVLLAGGKGARLWPMSRKGLPKHLISMFGEKSLFQNTVLRALPLLDSDDYILIVTNADQQRLLMQQLENLNVDMDRIKFIIEPCGRNTAPAVVWAVLSLFKIKQESIVLMLPCDHMIIDVDAFTTQMRVCRNFVLQYKEMVVFGIRPSYPATGYGYIQADSTKSKLIEGQSFYKVFAFKEKPSEDLAKRYVKEKTYFWNSGMLMFELNGFIEEAKNCMPQLVSQMEEIVSADSSIQKKYSQIEPISLDYALLEKTKDLWILPAKFSWSDMGSWSAVYELQDKDECGNVVLADAILLDCKENLVIGSKNKTIGMINQHNLIVIDTSDSLLICGMDDVQRVKEIASLLEKNHYSSWVDPAKVERGWGYYIVLDKGARFKTKRLVVYPGKALSLQRHQHRSEHWVVLQGVAKVKRDNEVFYVHANQSTYIPVGVVHKLENPGRIPLEIIEVQNGDYLEEDDIERFD